MNDIGGMGDDARENAGTFTIFFGTPSEFVAVFAVLSSFVVAGTVLLPCVSASGHALADTALGWHILSIGPAYGAWRLSLALRGRANEIYCPQGAALGAALLAMVFASNFISGQAQDALGCRRAATVASVRGG